MSSDDAGRRGARVWVHARGGLILVGERYRLEGGELAMVWHVDPASIKGVMWIEDAESQAEEASSF